MAPALDSSRLFAIAALASALLTLLFILTPAPQHAPSADLLPYFRAHQMQFVVSAVAILAWVIASILLVVAVGQLVSGDRPTLAFAATLLCSGGILLLGFGTFTFVGALFALAAANDVVRDPAQVNFQALFWHNLSFMLSDPGLMVLGAGQVMFGWLMWGRRVFSRYVATVLLVGGAAGLLTLAVYQTPALAFVQLFAFAIAGAACGWHLLRSATLPLAMAAEPGTLIE